MANKQEDQYLEDYLQGDSALSEAYRAEKKSHPPTHLDKAILSVAKEAVRSDHSPKVAYSPFARTWYVPASMAAVESSKINTAGFIISVRAIDSRWR